MQAKTRECSIADLHPEILSVIEDLLDSEEPLFCFETKEVVTGLLGYVRIHALVATESVAIYVYRTDNFKVDHFEIMYLNHITNIIGGESDERLEVNLYSSDGDHRIKFFFENTTSLYSFARKIRHAITMSKV